MNHTATILSATPTSGCDMLTVKSLRGQVAIPTREVTAMSLQPGQTAATTRLTILMFGTILVDVLAPDAASAFRRLKSAGVREVPSMSRLHAEGH